ncbi:hypothetical protein C9374_002687 [Naegleria lovaniensis]|uniref:UNC-50 family protein n=1 Tax=Naegleria lovaniensis TaxID=51637 RepID=A0AA88GUV5_NAELO|nr:uncharacterized protein C9374_002687 [Naegleria lovaniensis]KAG2386241.1 hypothetical protein C9374_002687 [Naegleria lovaniensis]
MISNKPPTMTPASSISSINHTIGDQEQIIQFILRMFKWRQLDFKGALTQMAQIIISPDTVYKNARNRKYIKDRYSRDDPAFVILLAIFMLIIGLIYSITFHKLSLFNYVSLMSYLFLFDFLFIGIFISTICWLICNKFLIDAESGGNNNQENVEWLYSFDVHTNSFIPVFILLYVVQYTMLPILTMDNIIGTSLSALLFMFAFSYYNYLTFKGYLNLTFIKNSEIFLYPIAVILVFTVVCIFTGFNCTKAVLSVYIDPKNN